jgi:glycosyltransferase involved in cell wall biosynthesis
MTEDQRPTAVNQYHGGTAVGDAITDQMLAWRQHLRALGHRSEIFADHVHPDLATEIRPLSAYLGDADALLIVHHSMGTDGFDDMLDLPERKALAFHNITPERFFDDEHTRRYARLGQRQLRRFVPHASAAVADSGYNRRDLIRAGYERVSVIPVRTEFDMFHELRRDRRSHDWLFVGRVVPNKRQLDLVEAFVHHARADRRVRLHLVGDLSFSSYVEQVCDRVRKLGLDHRVVLHGKVSDLQLLRLYERAGVFVCLSEHEGFGVPLLEAMAAGLPVVARASAAVPETMGGAGVLLHDEAADAIGHIVMTLTGDETWRSSVIDGQHRRIARLAGVDVRAALTTVVRDALGEKRPIEVQIQGPFETSYSLAIVNRRLAVELSHRSDVAVSIYATEGPGDYEPRAEDLGKHPQAALLHARAAEVAHPDVVIRQLYPPRVADAPGGVNLMHFGWEESRIPAQYVRDFNRYLDGIGTTSAFVADVLVDCGVTVLTESTGNGVDRPSAPPPNHLSELQDRRRFTFLNISSAFPRKGIDVLLRAYFDAFTGADDVTLVLKTFPNPHNNVAAILSELRQGAPDPPDVRWIDRDLDQSELDGLYAIASCYVHPSRGEGFGLPVGEAMLAGVPVIGVAHSGTADFMDDTVAVTIPYRIEAAATHLSVDGSEWAEPDGEALADALRLMVVERDGADIRRRVEAARDRIANHHSWPVVAARWYDLIERARRQAFVPNVALVSTWNARCGIAEHSRYLVRYLGESAAVRIEADRDAVLLGPDSEIVHRSWRNRWEPELSALRARLISSDADVVHIQFNYGFFEPSHLGRLLGDLSRDGRGTVVSLHATHDPVIDGTAVRLGDIARPLNNVDRIIVHQQHDVDALARFGVIENVELLPLGVPLGGLPPRRVVREALGVGERPVVATFGFALPHKGLLELIRATARLAEHMPDVLLIGCSALHDDPSSAIYFSECLAEVGRFRMGDNIRLISEFLDDNEARTILSAADLVVLPYGPTAESSSAALRFVLGVGSPVLTTDLPIFADASAALEQISGNDPELLAAAIGGLLGDDARRSEVARRCRDYARSMSWTMIARRHAEIYREVARGRYDRR